MPNPQSKNIDAGTRLQALALAEHGVPRHIITSLTSVASPTIGRYQRQARDRGYNPDISHALLLSYVIDKPRSGRPRKNVPDVEGKENSYSRKVGEKKKCEDVERKEDGAGASKDVIEGEWEKGEEEVGAEEEERMNLDSDSLPPRGTTNLVHEHITTQPG